MPAEENKESDLEIGHVLFVDIVGYSKLLLEEQKSRLHQLIEIVLQTPEVREATDEQLVRLPTGDGMALVFRRSSAEPARCALEIAQALKQHPEIPVRMGIHSGPVEEVTDVSGRTNLAGTGINLAQRVMDCGDAGHILLSRHVAEDLTESARWRAYVHELGTFEVKHGVRVEVANLYSDEIGNPKLPSKLQALRKHRARVRWAEVAIGLVMLGAIFAGAFFFLRRPDQSLSAVAEKSLAVLPFVDMSQAKDQEYFSDGISEELLNLLGKIPQLQVAARTSSFSFKGKQIEIPEIARQLRVAHVLEGSVRKSGDQVRITAQLIRAAEGYHVWSQTWERKLEDIFKIQDDIAGEVVKQLKVTLLGAAPTVRQTDPQAYTLFLQARKLGRQATPESFQQSDALYRQVLEIDPRYAPAWDGLATNFINKGNTGLLPDGEPYAHAREATEKALALDPDYAPAHSRMGYIAMLNNDFADAAKHYERALALDPTNLLVLGNTSTFLEQLGRLDEALALLEAIVQRDPVNTTALYNLASTQRLARRYDAAIASYNTVLSLSPNRGGAHEHLGISLLLKGNAPAALAEIEQEKIEIWRAIGLPMAYHALGRKTDSNEALDALIAKYEAGASNIAYVYAFCGNADKAFEWLDKAVEDQEPGLEIIVGERLFDKVRSDPRWLPFLRKLGMAPEQLAKIQFKVPLPP